MELFPLMCIIVKTSYFALDHDHTREQPDSICNGREHVLLIITVLFGQKYILY